MKYEFEKIVTRGGDSGKSKDWDGRTHSKSSLLFEVLGEIDELSSWLGKVKHLHNSGFYYQLNDIQIWLQYAGSMVATEPLVHGEIPSPTYEALKKVSIKEIDKLEEWMRGVLESGLKVKDGFVLPGKSLESADMHIARSVCRRVERVLVRFMVENENRYDLKNVSIFLNRLSDYLFVWCVFLEK